MCCVQAHSLSTLQETQSCCFARNDDLIYCWEAAFAITDYATKYGSLTLAMLVLDHVTQHTP
jgi:hypothetical protein